jgi:transcriptional regulator with XRE-family HTH domain
LDYYSLNASAFADKIGVQRSSLSHLLSGRNKPSLDFILKILEVFPDVDLYWILNGKGNFPKNSDENRIGIITEKKNSASTPIIQNQIAENLFSTTEIPVVKNSIENIKTILNEIL